MLFWILIDSLIFVCEFSHLFYWFPVFRIPGSGTRSPGSAGSGKRLKKQWWKKVLALLEKPSRIPYTTCRLWRLLEAFSPKGSKKHPKSITFIDKTHRVSQLVVKPYKTNEKWRFWGNLEKIPGSWKLFEKVSRKLFKMKWHLERFSSLKIFKP